MSEQPVALRVLYVEDSPYDADLTIRHFRRSAPHIRVDVVPGMTEGLRALEGGGYDLLLTDLRMSDGDGMAVLGAARERSPWLPVVVITGGGSTETASAALRAGADDYVVKRADYLERLPSVVEGAVTRHHDERRRRATPLRVLYAEHDERDIDLTLRQLSRTAPHLHVTPVRTLRELHARVTEGAWDAVLMDYRMPDGSTLDSVKALRLDARFALPILFVSGQGDEDVVVRALRVGVSDYLVKTDGYLLRLPLALESAVYRARSDASRVALAESEARFRRLAENALDGIYRVRVSPARGVEFVNRAMARQLDARPEALCGDASVLLGRVHADDRAAFEAVMDDPAGHPEPFALRFVRPDEAVVWTEHRVVPVHDDAGRVVALEGIARDVSERRRMEARLAQAERMEAVGRLAGGVAHDLNNLITAVMGWADIARDELPEDHPTRADLVSIQDAASRAAGVARQLLTLARQQATSPRLIDVNAHLHGLTHLLGRLLGPNVRLDTRLAPRPLTARVDPTQFEQVLVNLVVNARDAMPAGGVVVIESAVTAFEPSQVEHPDALPAGHYAMIAVTDTGGGIPPEVLPHVFEPFFTTKSTGSGLGLATCYGVVTQQRGHISVYSEVGVGTTFKVYLPLVDEAASSWPPLELTDDARGGSETVLVAEDDPAVASFMARVLRRLGYTALVASSGAEALEFARLLGPGALQLVVADVVMPGTGGRALVEALQAARPGLAALYVSAYPEGAILAHRRLPEGAHFLSKPFSAAQFARVVRALLDAPP